MGSPERLLIIGGSDAGLSAALRARELDSTITPLMVLADEYPNFSICGIPFYLSREAPDYWHLAHRTRTEIEALGIRVRTSTRAVSVDPKSKTCLLRAQTGSEEIVEYERLVLGYRRPIRFTPDRGDESARRFYVAMDGRSARDRRLY
jgi:NADPH-dependent 2,4-dienoyl-CoA reductase/sulfur reductase-like enzyme